MSRRSFSYLRTLRRSYGITQPEMATLVGLESPSAVSRIERGLREPSLSVLIGYQLVFGRTTKMLFPREYGEEEDRLAQVIDRLLADPRRGVSRRDARVRECLSLARSRLVIRSPESHA